MLCAPQPSGPLIEVAVEPKSKADARRLRESLAEMGQDDAAFVARIDQDSGQILLGGNGELHLDDKVAILLSRYAIGLNIGAPQVCYRETIGHRTEVDYTHKRQFGDRHAFARVLLVVEPAARGSGVSFTSTIPAGAMPDAFMPGIEKGLKTVLPYGILAGFPVVDIAITLIDGAHHEKDSSAHSFEVASRAALREALQKGRSFLLEPVMAVDIVVPEDQAAGVTSDLTTRRGRVTGRHVEGGQSAIAAKVPLSNLFGYANQLRCFTRGAGTFTMQFARYEPLPSVDVDPDPWPPAAAAALRA